MGKRETAAEKILNQPLPPYARLFFDHLYSEYLDLKPSIQDSAVRSLLEEIHEKRQKRELRWNDIYTFDLTLVDTRPPESLIRKAYDARARYRSVAGQKEYDEYVASKPPDLTEIRFEADAPPPNPIALLRADIKYLLSKFYLYYAMLPVREGLRDQLTKWAVILTGGVVVLIAIAIVLNVGASFLLPGLRAFDQYSVVFVTVLTVTLAGIVGGCISMLQRIQSAPSEGDALFNLAALTNGWRGIILSPLYGGIFASLLFVLFAAGILNGSVFPVINTPKTALFTPPAPAPSPTTSPSLSQGSLLAPSPTPSGGPSALSKDSPKPPGVNSSPAAVIAVSQPEPQKSPSPAPSPAPAVAKGSVLQIKDFLRETGPADGISYALLIIWSFLAGFAERLVPDTLNRLVAKNQAIQGGNS